MSNSTAHDQAPVETPQGYGTLFRPVEAISFWAAVGLPFIYVPLVLTGIQAAPEQIAAALLVVAHVIALVLGRHHKAE